MARPFTSQASRHLVAWPTWRCRPPVVEGEPPRNQRRRLAATASPQLVPLQAPAARRRGAACQGLGGCNLLLKSGLFPPPAVQALCLVVLMTCGQALASGAFSTPRRALHSIQHSSAGSARSRKLPELPANYGDAPKAKIRIKNGCNKPIVVALMFFYSDWGAAWGEQQ